MNRTLRIHKIDQMLNNRHHVTISDFLDALEVSLSTLKRDLEFMRLHLNAPIHFDRNLKAYRFVQPTAPGPRYELPGLWLDSAEAHALVAASNLLERIEPGLLGPHVAPLKTRLLSLLALEGVSTDNISHRIRLLTSLKRQMPTRHFQIVARATLERLRLRITHLNRHTGRTTDREISPQRLTHYRENWYVESWCHARSEIRSFAIDALTAVEILSTVSKEISEDTLNARLDSGYGIFNGTNLQWAVLDFSPRRAQWVSRIAWHDMQRSEWMQSGWYRITFPYTDDRELLNDILAHAEDVIVRSPDSLVQRVCEAYRSSLAHYQ